jgi:hypothetical protein
MKPPADGWDRDEREAVEDLQDELTSLQARHRDDPPVDLLRAAEHDALPADLQAAAEQHVSKDSWSQTLLAGFGAAETAEVALAADAEDRILARIRSDTSASTKTETWSWRWLAGLTAAATGLLAVVLLLRPGADVPGQVRVTPPQPSSPSQSQSQPQPQPQPPIAGGRSAAPLSLSLEKPDVVLSLKALTWRGAGDANANPLVAGLKQPLDAFRRGDYAHADRELVALEPRFPEAVEVFFYGGVARLFLDEPKRAVASLRRASELADDSFTSRVAWYRAIAEERAGNDVEARRQLDTVCRAGGERAREACTALGRSGATKRPDAR